MRSFLLASAALCLTWGLSGCDTPTDTKPVNPPPVIEKPADVKPADAPKEKMEPTPAPVEKPADAPK